MNRRGLLATIAAAAVFAGGAGVLTGCPTSATTTLYTPITGFVIDSYALTSDVGCGPAPGQVYKYAAVVTGTLVAVDGGYVRGPGVPGLPVSGLFDCFANAQFSNLSTPDGGTTDYNVSIYAFEKSAIPASADCATTGADAGCPGDDPAYVKTLEPLAAWTTTCVGTQVPGTSQNAVCGSLIPFGEGGAADGGAEGGADSGDAGPPPDAARDAAEAGDAADSGPPADASDAGDSGPPDATDSATPTDAGDDGG